MWDIRKLLLAAFAFTALYYKAQSAKLLDMSPDAVDDLYEGCREKAMKTFIQSGLLNQEINNSEGFKKAWSVSKQCSKQFSGGTADHTAALSTFANGDTDFIETFNTAVETLGVNVSTYENHFHFKSLHFLLMDSMGLLNKQCMPVYGLFPEETYTAKTGSEVKFGRFTKVYQSYSMLKKLHDWDGQVFFNITSCFFVNLGDNICSGDNDVVLLSPAEVFTVADVKKKSDELNDDEYTEIVLKHSEMDSAHNCFIFSRSPADVSTQWLVLLLVSLSLLFFNC